MAEIKITSTEDQLREELAKLRAAVFEARQEKYEQEPSSLQYKIERQKAALRNLNKRVRMQRLILRELNAHDPELADTLFNLVKDKYAAELDDEFVLTI